jgi:hypothetical protein
VSPVVLNVDHDSAACAVSSALAAKLGDLAGGMEFACVDAGSAAQDLAAFDAVFIAALVGVSDLQRPTCFPFHPPPFFMPLAARQNTRGANVATSGVHWQYFEIFFRLTSLVEKPSRKGRADCKRCLEDENGRFHGRAI